LDSRGREAGGKRYALAIAAVAAAYTVAGKLGLELAYETSSVTAIWAPTGIALAALVLGGYRLWPAVALGALLTNLDTGVPALTVLGITAGNTLEALAGAYLLRRFAGFDPRLERVRDVLSLVVCGAIVSTSVSASIGVTSLLAGDEIAFGDVGSVWRTWWLGDMGGDLIVAPALLVAATHRPFTRVPGGPLEAVALALALVGMSVVVFMQSTDLVYLVFPALIWAALRFVQPGAAFGSLLLAAVAVIFTDNGQGPFASSGPDERLLLSQTLVGVAGVTALVLAALTSARQRAEHAVREVAAILQESLLPTQLPDLPRIDSAVYFRPAGEGHRVGGDFYDAFEVSPGSWAVVMGDVCGKGPRAAALTALARYTLREVSVHQRVPSQVLGALNAALGRQCEDSEFCTAVYARLDLNGAGARVTLSSGGHPLPSVLRSDGSVEQLGEHGTLLGVYADPTLVDRAVDLGPGEVVVFYTDGLTDAYAPRRIVEVRELEAILRSCVGRSSTDVLAAIEQRLLPDNGLEPRDDVAIVVLQLARDARA
jgi:integral membrane sensor domain MASE1